MSKKMEDNIKAIVVRSDVLIDGSSGEPLKDAGILIEEGRIIRVAPWSEGVPWPQGENIIQLKTPALIPGLINIHVHVSSEDDLDVYLKSGITSVRDVGTVTGNQFGVSLQQVKNEIENGERRGPGIFSYGVIIDGPKSTLPIMTVSVSNESEARAEVDRQVAAGVDGIKLYWKLVPRIAKAIIDRTKEHGLPVAGHIGMLIGGVKGARMGIDTIEHLISFMRDLFPAFIRPGILPLMKIGALDDVSKGLDTFFDIWRKVDPESRKMKRLAENFAATGAVFHPTTVALERMTRIGEINMKDDPRYKKMMEFEHVKELYDMTRPKEWNEKLSRLGKEAMDGMLGFINCMFKADVPIGVGTDDSAPYVFPGESMHEEMAFLVRAGITPLEVIRMATARNAGTLRRDDLGTISTGKSADMVLLNRDPCSDITATQDIGYVVKAGKIVYSDKAVI